MKNDVKKLMQPDGEPSTIEIEGKTYVNKMEYDMLSAGYERAVKACQGMQEQIQKMSSQNFVIQMEFLFKLLDKRDLFPADMVEEAARVIVEDMGLKASLERRYPSDTCKCEECAGPSIEG